MNRRRTIRPTVALLCAVVPLSLAEEGTAKPPPAQVLFENVRVFDGTSGSLSSGSRRAAQAHTLQAGLPAQNYPHADS